jgi:hypothetical protein
MNRAIRNWSNGQRYAATLLLAFVLLMRVLVPAGWMPTQTVDGFRVELCSGTTGKTVLIPGIKLVGQQEKHDAAKQVCDFAAAAQAASLPDLAPAPELLPQAAPGVTLASYQAPAPGRGLAAPPPPATGPPTLS